MQPYFMNRIDLFPTPVWCYQFPNFKEDKEKIMQYIDQDHMYFTKAERNGLQVTEGNLHDKTLHPQLSKVTDFFQECFEDVMDKCGYAKDIGITAMWATRQKQMGFHHDHIHTNSFLAGVLYVNDVDNNAQGTLFKNPAVGYQVIEPRINRDKAQFFTSEAPMAFIPGMALIFPSWAVHATPMNDSKSRLVFASNCMPIGRANADHYHQYDFPNPKDFGFLPLNEDVKQGYSR